MAQDYSISSTQLYDQSSGNLTFVFGPSTIGGTGTDDGFWDPGDPTIHSNPFVYVGSYTANGHLFLVFENATQAAVMSPTAAGADAGYPANYNNDTPPLDTMPLAVCFAKGTLIACPGGARRVETLEIGETILTAAGTATEVRWIGRQTLDMRLPDAGRNCLVRILAGALGKGVPYTDLEVTGDHGMIVDGMVINASVLVNGDTIDFVPIVELPDSLTVYHIETKAHDVILANGAPLETFIDAVGRAAFDNYQDYLDLYGAERIIPEKSAPRISSQRMLPNDIKARLGITPSMDFLRMLAC